MTDLRAIEASFYDDPDDPDVPDPDHASIDLRPANWRAFEDEECTPREWWLALIDIAGILGRVAIALASDVAASARRHHCVIEYVPSWSEPLMGLGLMGCHIGGSFVLSPGRDLGSSPALNLNVPRKDLQRYLDRVREVLEAIADDENRLDALFPLEGHDDNTLTTVATHHAGQPKDPAAHAWVDDGSGRSCTTCGLPREQRHHHPEGEPS